MRNIKKIASTLVIIGIACYIINLAVYIPRFMTYKNAVETWNYTMNHNLPNPLDYGLDTTSHIVSGVLANAAYTLILVGGGYLLAVLAARIARQLGYLKNQPEDAEKQS